LDASCLARDERASARLLLFQFVGYLPLYIGTIKPNCDDFDAIRRIGRFDHTPGSNPADLISRKLSSAPVVVAIHRHIGVLLESIIPPLGGPSSALSG